MLFAVEDIEKKLPDSFDKGLSLYTSGIISAPNVQRNGELVTAVIPRANSKPLRVYVRVSKNAGKLNIAGECTCAQRENCEHVAAVLLQALADSNNSTIDLNTSGSKKTGKKKQPTAIQQRLLYIIDTDFPSGDNVLVETGVARKLKNGGYGRMNIFDPSRSLRGTPPSFLMEEDLPILNALSRLNGDTFAHQLLLEGPESGQLLEAMLNTQRCFWEDADGPKLKLGNARTTQFSWEMDKFGVQFLVCDLPSEVMLLPLAPPYFLNIDTNECGPLNSNLPATLFMEIMVMSPVLPEQAAPIQQEIDQRYPDEKNLPQLSLLEIEDVSAVKPKPCLRLITDAIDENWDHDVAQLDFAVLSFDYDGMQLRDSDPPTLLKDNRIVRVQRDEKAEQTYIRQLEKLDFELDDEWSELSGNAYFFLSDYVDDWLDFQLEDIPKLRKKGWRIEYDKSFRYQLATAQRWLCNAKSVDNKDWFDIGLGVEVDGEPINLLSAIIELLQEYPRGLPKHFDDAPLSVLPLEDGRLLAIPRQRLRLIYTTLLEMYESGDVTDQHVRLSRVQLPKLLSLESEGGDTELQWLADEETQALIERLRDVEEVPAVAPPADLQTQLRSYQQRGLDWLQFLREFHLAGILADDMGLGKTVQALAHISLEKQHGRLHKPCLVVAPTSLVFNWCREAARFTPQLKVLALHGPKRSELFDDVCRYDLVLTTYPLLPRDESALLKHTYHLVILDEAQVIKNPKAKASRIVRRINTQHRLCLTGTPLENHLGELWSLFDFLLPGLLGNEKQFRRFFRTPIEKHADKLSMERLTQRIRPYLLRRTKEAVAPELPPKTEIIRSVALEGGQRDLYESVRTATYLRVRQEVERQGIARSHIIILDALLKLRQVCCDPRLVKMDNANNVKESAKLSMLMDLLPEMIEEGRRVLLFSQFTGMLSLIEEEVKRAKLGYVKLTGQTRNRAQAVERFQAREVPLFLISLKAGGVGLNLTAADTVIHYDPWWNPAVERQATDRAYRIGQDQPVFVYKFLSESTVEEKILAMQERKQALADNLYGENDSSEPKWSEQDLEQLFAPLS